MSELKKKEKITWKDSISILANVVAIITFVITYFTDEKLIKIIAIICGIVLYVFLLVKNRELTKQLQKSQDHIKDLEETNRKNNTILQRIADDIINGKVSSELMIICYMEERINRCLNYIKMGVDVFIDYVENEKFLDVRYCWQITGQNISCEETLSELNFLISGDSNIKNNNELNMTAEIETNNEWRRINANIKGGDRIKLLNMQFGDYAVAPNDVFKVRFSYIWPHSYCAEGDKFSFGGNTFSAVNTSSMNIKIRANKKCFNYAKKEVRENLDGGKWKTEYQDIDIIEVDGENVITVPLPKSETDRAIYIVLTP